MSESTPPKKPPLAAESEMHCMSRRSFLWAAVATGSALSGWRWLITQKPDDGVPWPLRRTLQFNEKLARNLYNPNALAPLFPRDMATEPRQNGFFGMSDADGNFMTIDLADWRLTVDGLAGGEPLSLTMADIKMLPRHEMTTELKCIEGWSVVVHWAGARFSDFAAKYGPATRSGAKPDVRANPNDIVEYVGLATPDEQYYVGLDIKAALHPQTLLCYEMNGKPLTQEHGAPLRLVTPLKYGVKHIKRIGLIRFSEDRPADYWAEQGYDWYTGH